MNFYINQHATLPLLVMELVSNGRGGQDEFFRKLQSSSINFCMRDAKTGKVVIPNHPAICICVKSKLNPTNEEYMIGYKFTERETKNAGVFIGQFTIETREGSKLIVPIQEELIIHILDSSIK